MRLYGRSCTATCGDRNSISDRRMWLRLAYGKEKVLTVQILGLRQ